jgi:hypothetical protein
MTRSDGKANADMRDGKFRKIVEDVKLTPRLLSDVSSSFHVMFYARG